MRSALLLAAGLAALWPELHWFYLRTRYASQDREELVALAAAVAVLLAVREGRSAPRRSLAGPALLVLGLAGARTFLPELAAALAALCALAWTASLLWTKRRFHAGLFGLLLLALPIVPMFQLQLGMPLRTAAAGAAAGLLRAQGVAVERIGTCLEWNGALVAVDPPCSGLAMAWTTLLLAMTAASLARASNAATAVAAALALLAALAANVLRTAALFRVEVGLVDLPSGAHAGVGLACQALAAALVLAFVTLVTRRRPPCSTLAS